MSLSTKTITTGLTNGLKTTWILGKIIFPITVILTMLSYTPVIGWIVWLCRPVMQWLGLPGEAAIPIVLGNVLNLYAAIGGILSLSLTVKSVFILAVMLSFSHNLFVETALAKKIGVNPWIMVGVRLGLAFLSAIAINLLWRGGEELAKYGFVGSQTPEAEGFFLILWLSVKKALMGILQMAIVVMPLMLGIQVLKDLQILRYLSQWMNPITSSIGVAKHSAVTLLAGLLFGLAMGAGVIIQAVKEEPLPKRDLYLLMVFLVACHAVVEDTLIFIPLGIPVWPLLFIRLVVAFIVTVILSRVWDRILQKRVQKGDTVEI